MEYILNGKRLDISTPCVMGILNLTPDSFYDGGRWNAEKEVLKKTEQMIRDGMRILDIGGQSTRPGATCIEAGEELNRIYSHFKNIRKEFPDLVLSIDTFHPEVAEKTLEGGADIINDISGGSSEDLLRQVHSYRAGYVLMHIKGVPTDMQKKPFYTNVTMEVLEFIVQRSTMLEKMGITSIFTDPGFGFGKSLDHNFELLKNIPVLAELGYPVLVGISRKSMVTRVLGNTPEEALSGTTALHMVALQHGAKVLRVHDVKEAAAAIKIHTFMQTAKKDIV